MEGVTEINLIALYKQRKLIAVSHLVEECRLPVAPRAVLGKKRPKHLVVQVGAPRSIRGRGGDFFRGPPPEAEPGQR